MKKSVALATGHTVQNSNVFNGEWTGVNGLAKWICIEVGTALDTSAISTFVSLNYVGYDAPDWNTTSGSAQQFKLRTKVLNQSNNFTCINAGSSKVTVTCYPLVPRHAVNVGREPLTELAGGRSGDLIAPGANQMPYEDPRFTPYMCPELCMGYKILKPRSFTVHGGGKFNLNLRHSYDIVNYNAENPVVVGEKHCYRAMLVKFVGELGLVNVEAARYIRNLPVQIIWKNNQVYSAHASKETRLIIDDFNIGHNQTVSGTTGDEFLNQEINAVEAVQRLDPTSFV